MEISIPEPCTESLQNMKPIEGGLYCDVCSHAVIDFRNWSENEIQDYFKTKSGKTCGIFKKEQTTEDKTVIITPDVNYSHLSFTQRFLYALLLCFGTWLFSGCNIFDTHTTGKPVPPTKVAIPVMGLIEPDPKTINDSTHCEPLNAAPEQTLKGNVKYEDILPEPITNDELLEIENVVSEPDIKKGQSENIWVGTIEIMPQFPGGREALSKFIQANLVYPEYEKIRGIEGRVYVGFEIDELGNVDNPQILRGVNEAPHFNEEVIRVVKMMPKWKPGSIYGKPIKMKFNLPIEFKLK